MTVFSAAQENIKAQSAMNKEQKLTNKKLKCCWTCQKDKQPFGGKLIMRPNFHMFICKDCMDIKKAKVENT